MGLFEQWKELANKEKSKQDNDVFWKDYLEKEKNNYEFILENRQNVIEGTITELASKFEMNEMYFAGFLDGINTSLIEPLELEDLEGSSKVALNIDFEKLYFNMLDAKADWLYNLEQWEEILTQERRNQITKEFRISKMAVSSKVGRNDPCTCGSGKKYKKCCGK